MLLSSGKAWSLVLLAPSPVAGLLFSKPPPFATRFAK